MVNVDDGVEDGDDDDIFDTVYRNRFGYGYDDGIDIFDM